MAIYTLDITTPSTSTEGKAPAISGTTPSTSVPAVQQTTSDKAPEQISTAAALPDGYLSKGYYVGEGKGRYVDPELVEQAEAIGKALAESGVKPAVLNKMVRTLKTAARLPYPAQQGSLKKLTPQVLEMEHKKKAPPMLREMVEKNQAAVQNEADFTACLDHLRDVSIYLTAAQR